MLSRSQVRQAPPVSCSSATRYRPGIPEGMEAMLVRASVFLNETWQLIQLEVPM